MLCHGSYFLQKTAWIKDAGLNCLFSGEIAPFAVGLHALAEQCKELN